MEEGLSLEVRLPALLSQQNAGGGSVGVWDSERPPQFPQGSRLA